MLHIVNRMNRHQRFFLTALAVAAGLGLWAGCQSAHTPAPATTAAAALPGVKPGPNDASIAWVAAQLMEGAHYQQRPLDHELSAKIFDGYIDALDPRHENFLQADLAEFVSIRTNLDLMLAGSHRRAELGPAFAIYDRFAQRFQQHSEYVGELLKQDKFKFNTDEKIMNDRRHEPFPKDLDEAKQLWRQRLRFDYLIEKLARELSETNGVFTVKLPPNAATNITATLSKHNRWILRMMTNWDHNMVLQTYLNFGLAHAYDPHSDYFGAPKAQDFSIDMSLSLFGIGAQLTEDDGYCTIRELLPGGPAIMSKQLKADDRIVAVAQGSKPPVDAVDMELEKVVQMIRGPKGTEVRLTISPGEDRTARRIVPLIRDEIKLEGKEAKAQLIEFPGGKRIGVIDLPSFYASISLPGNENHSAPKYTTPDVARLVNKLKAEKVDGIILDLRSNPGGSLEEAVKFTGLFIKDGPVVLAREANGQIIKDFDPDPGVLYDGPLVVMLNRFSASASEIAAAALQDYGRAIIVGDVSTHGKGTVQQLLQLKNFPLPFTPTATNDPGTLKITKGKFYRVSGASTQLKGVASDIVLPGILNHSTLIGEGALDNALAWDTIPPASYDKLNLVQPYLAELSRGSQDRIRTNQDFSYIRQDIEQFMKMQADKSTTLNEHEAILERERVARQNKARDKEREARPLPAVKIYELTVKNSAEPGLPAPKSFWVTNEVAVNTGPKDKSDKEALARAFATHEKSAKLNSSDANLSLGASLENLDLAAKTTPLSSTNHLTKPVVTKSYQPDPTLEESENILLDYISLLTKNGILTAYQ